MLLAHIYGSSMVNKSCIFWLIWPMVNSANAFRLNHCECCWQKHHCCHCVALHVYSTTDQMVDTSEFICGIYIGIFPPIDVH